MARLVIENGDYIVESVTMANAYANSEEWIYVRGMSCATPCGCGAAPVIATAFGALNNLYALPTGGIVWAHYSDYVPAATLIRVQFCAGQIVDPYTERDAAREYLFPDEEPMRRDIAPGTVVYHLLLRSMWIVRRTGETADSFWLSAVGDAATEWQAHLLPSRSRFVILHVRDDDAYILK